VLNYLPGTYLGYVPRVYR